MKIASRRNLSQIVAEQLMEQIRTGHVSPGDRLPTERELMAEYGVGRGAIREGIQSLVAMGVLDVRPGRGAVVLGLTTDEVLDATTVSALLESQTVEDLYDFRELLEGAAASRAAIQATADDRAAIAQALERLHTAFAKGRANFFQEDLAFHRSVVVASENAIFVRVLDAVADLLSVSRRETQYVEGAIERAMGEHQAIYAAIERGDSEAARLATVQHVAAGRAAARAAQMNTSRAAQEEGPGATSASGSRLVPD